MPAGSSKGVLEGQPSLLTHEADTGPFLLLPHAHNSSNVNNSDVPQLNIETNPSAMP